MTKPRLEEVADENLQRQGYGTYLPRIEGKIKRAGTVSRGPVAMFPRYMFIELEEGVDNWAPIRSTRGVQHLVRFGLMPVPVPAELIEYLRGRENDQGYHDAVYPEIKAGDRVRITEGVMAGYEGICNARTGKERVEILLDLVGNANRVTVKTDEIELAS